MLLKKYIFIILNYFKFWKRIQVDLTKTHAHAKNQEQANVFVEVIKVSIFLKFVPN